MSLKPMLSVLFAFLLGNQALALTADHECYGPGGDGGPKPLLDISDEFDPRVRTLETAGQIKEFFLWERRGLLLYRNDWGEVYDAHVSGGMPRPYYSSFKPLSRLVDKEERYITFAGSPYVHDVKTGIIYSYSLPPASGKTELTHLFWKDRKLYSVFVVTDNMGGEQVSIQKFSPDEQMASTVCSPKTIPASSRYQLATGHVFPYASFYRVELASNGRSLIRLFEIDVTREYAFCDFVNVAKQNWYVAGPVESVHRFPQIDGLAVKMFHPTKNLLWADNTGCRHFHLGDVKAMVPNYRLPTLFTWSPKGVGTLHFLTAQTQATVIDGSKGIPPIENITETSLWLTADSKKLFLAPTFRRAEQGTMLQINLESASSRSR